MKRKILFFIVACVFAIVATSNTTQNTPLPIFRETTMDRLFEDIQKNNEKNYPLFTIKKIDMESSPIHKDDIIYMEDLLKVESHSLPEIKIELIEKIISIKPDYTILSRYKERVLRN